MKDHKFTYKHVVVGKDVIAIGHYGGKAYKGIAHCHPNDKFDLDAGIKLAEAKCEVKLTEARAKDATRAYQEAQRMKDKAEAVLASETDYLLTCSGRYDEACDKLIDLLTSM